MCINLEIDIKYVIVLKFKEFLITNTDSMSEFAKHCNGCLHI